MMDKKRGEVGAANGAWKPLRKPAAEKIGSMFAELLSLDLEDEALVDNFCRTYWPQIAEYRKSDGALTKDERKRLLSKFAASVNCIQADFKRAGTLHAQYSPEAVGKFGQAITYPGKDRARTMAVEVVLELIESREPSYMRHLGKGDQRSIVDPAFMEELVSSLERCAPQFSRLRDRFNFIEPWIDRYTRRLSDSFRDNLTCRGLLAAFSLEVGAFGDIKKPRESDVEARARIEKRFSEARARVYGRRSTSAAKPTNRAPPHSAK